MRIYFDENFSPALVDGLRRIQDGRRSEDVTVCSLRDEFGIGAPDERWISGVASRHGVVITQDLNIHRIRAQRDLCAAHKAGMIFVRPPKNGFGYWPTVQLIIKFWPQMKEVSSAPRPFAFCLDPSETRLKPL